MDIIEAINSRYSVRAFTAEPVPREILEKVLQSAIRAPSWANTQTWELAVAGGDVMQELRDTLAARAAAQEEKKPAIAPPAWPSPYRERRKENGVRVYRALGIGRDDEQKKFEWHINMYRMFGAPCAIYIYADEGLSEWATLNIGLLTENICLAALGYGLGTVIMGAGINYPEDVRRILHIPENKRLYICIAVGYPDTEAVANRYRSSRVALETICSWHGF